MSSALPGVTFRPSASEYVPAETMPLMTPTMENQLLTELWIPTLCNPTSTEEITTSSWEEDYQDLSNWCIDTFQNHCVFHQDESNTSIHSGINSGNMSLSTDIVGDGSGTGEIDDKSMETTLQNSNCQTKSLSVNKKKNHIVEKKLNVPDIWLDLPQSPIAARDYELIPFLDNPTKTEAYQPILKITDKSVYPADNREKNWDIIDASSNAFDLLSYVCNDTMQIPESISIKDIENVPKKQAAITNTTRESSKITTRLRSRQKAKVVGHESQTITSPTIVNPINTKYSMKLSPSLTKSRTMTIRKKTDEAPYAARQKKRTIDSDSDDHSSTYSYKESREKNNEASRKSRMNKKVKEKEMIDWAEELEKNNRLLKMKLEHLDKIVTSMRAAILRSALKKN